MTKLFVPKKNYPEQVDAFLLLLCVGLTAFFSMNPLVFSKDDTGTSIVAQDTSMLPAYILVPLYVVFLLLATYIIFSRYRQTKVLPNHILLGVLIAFVLVRAVSLFSLPYGNARFAFHEAYSHDLITFYAENASVGERFLNLLNDTFYGISLLLLATYLKTFDDRSSRFVIDLVSAVFILLPLVGIVYSYFAEKTLWIQNLEYIFELKGHDFMHIRSFFGNRNVFGMFMLLATCLCTIRFWQKPDPLWILLLPVFLFNCALVYCRTSLLLIFGLLAATAILFPIFRFKEYKGYSITILCVLLSVFVFLIIFYLCKEDVVKKWFSILTNRGTMQSRHWYTREGLTMLKDPIYLFFGYGKPNFSKIFILYEQLIPDSFPLWTTHFLYTEYLLQLGLLGSLFVLGCYAYLVYYLFLHLRNKSIRFIPYALILLVFLIYGLSEMKGLFLLEGTSCCFLFVLVVPLLLDSKKLHSVF